MNHDYYPESAVSLAKKLRQIYDDNTYIAAVLADVIDYEEDIQAVIDFIDADIDVDMETVAVLAIELNNVRNPLND